ncbi:MAG: hypothetical protein FJZ95_04235 [Chloroflexi bacterium]|nr:hypothetical protein [Chloroflexota bacterium]
MKPNIWECDKHHIHVVHNGIEMKFQDIYEFMDALSMWQEYVMFHMVKFDSMPDEVWNAYVEANRN